ncbi:MAG: T9SS type A sorting domain-containing protein, partial [Candidatus Aegiribacteria sp.]|nr:T9SS type A sorting domain-containing protein [Candidatus Aegiribacteria sp.]
FHNSTPLRFCRTDVILGDYHKTLLPGIYDVHVTVEGYLPETVTDVLVGPEERVEVTFVLDMLGIEEGETGSQSPLGDLSVYPNPVLNSCEIRLPFTRDDGTVYVYSLTGHLVYRMDVPSQTTSIDWDCRGESGTEIPSGVYIVKFNSGGISTAERFIIDR